MAKLKTAAKKTGEAVRGVLDDAGDATKEFLKGLGIYSEGGEGPETSGSAAAPDDVSSSAANATSAEEGASGAAAGAEAGASGRLTTDIGALKFNPAFATKYTKAAYPKSIAATIRMLREAGAIGKNEKIGQAAQAAVERLHRKLASLPKEAFNTAEGENMVKAVLASIGKTTVDARNAGSSLGAALKDITRGAESPVVQSWAKRAVSYVKNPTGFLGTAKSLLKEIGGPLSAALFVIPAVKDAYEEVEAGKQAELGQVVTLPSGSRVTAGELDSMSAEDIMRFDRLKRARLRDMARTIRGGDISATNIKGLSMLEQMAAGQAGGGAGSAASLDLPTVMSLPGSAGFGK